MSAGLVAGCILTLVILYFLIAWYWKPGLFLYWMLLKIALGAGFLFLFNCGAAYWRLEISLNPFTTLVAGFLGVPGMVLLILAKYAIGI